MKLLTFDQSKCTNCGACSAVCSLEKKGVVQPAQARIRIKAACAENGEKVLRASVCQHCARPVCVTACMKGIVHKDPETGFVSRDKEGCIACAACAVMCPVGAAVLDTDANAFLTCDLCGGNPACVKVCSSGALSYADPAEASAAFRNSYALKAVGRGLVK